MSRPNQPPPPPPPMQQQQQQQQPVPPQSLQQKHVSARPSLKVGSACIKIFSFYNISEELLQPTGRHELIELVLKPTARYYYRDQRVTLLDFPERVISFEKSAVVKQNNRYIIDFNGSGNSRGVRGTDNRVRPDNTVNSVHNNINDDVVHNTVDSNTSETGSSHHTLSRSSAMVRRSVPAATRASSVHRRRKESHLRKSLSERNSHPSGRRPGSEMGEVSEAPVIGATRPPAAMSTFILSPSWEASSYSYQTPDGVVSSQRPTCDPNRPWTMLPKKVAHPKLSSSHSHSHSLQQQQQLCDVADTQPHYDNEFLVYFPTRVDLKVVVEVLVGVRLRRPCSTALRWVTPSLERIGANRDKIGSFAAAEGELLRHKIANRTVGLTVGYVSCRLSLPHVEMNLRMCGVEAGAMMSAALERLVRDDARLRGQLTQASHGCCASRCCGIHTIAYMTNHNTSSNSNNHNNGNVNNTNNDSSNDNNNNHTTTTTNSNSNNLNLCDGHSHTTSHRAQPSASTASALASTTALMERGSNVCQSMARLSIAGSSSAATSEDKLIACDSQSGNTVNTMHSCPAMTKTISTMTLMATSDGGVHNSSVGISSSESCHSHCSSSHAAHNVRSDIHHRLLMGESELSVYYSLLDRYDPDFFVRRVRAIQTMYRANEHGTSWVSTPAEELVAAGGGRGLVGHDLLQRLCVELGPEYAHISPRTRRMLFRWFYRLTDMDIASVEQTYFNEDVDALDHEPDRYMQALCTQFGHDVEPMHYNFPKVSYAPEPMVYFLDSLMYVSTQWNLGGNDRRSKHSSNSTNNHSSSSTGSGGMPTGKRGGGGAGEGGYGSPAGMYMPRPTLVLTLKEQPLRIHARGEDESRKMHEIDILLEKYYGEFSQIIPCIAHGIESVIAFNELPEQANRQSALATDEAFAIFISDVPCYSYITLLKRLANYTYLSPSSMMGGIIYLDRFCQNYPGFRITRHNIGKLLVTSVRVANKVIDLRSVNNLNFANAFAVSLVEMNKMEERFLKLIAFDLFISPMEFNTYAKTIQPPGTPLYPIITQN